VAKLIELYGRVDAKKLLEFGKEAAFIKSTQKKAESKKVKKEEEAVH
jgi:hypothetical protein